MGAAAELSRQGRRFTALVAATVTLLALGTGIAVAQADPDALVSDPASLVDPMIGTGSGGDVVGQVDTIPGAAAPFGMLTFSPDTPSRPDGGGYNYADNATTGFSLTHMSGPGCAAYGDFPVLPTVGALGTDPAGTTEPFDHSHEQASPGSYSVTLNPGTANAIQSDLGATTRTGFADFGFPRSASSNVLFKLGDAQSGNQAADVEVIGDNEVSGTETAGQFCGGQGTYPVHFVATFDRPFSSFGTWHTAPVGANVFTTPTGQLSWSYHAISSGGSDPAIAPTTTSDGASAISWQQSNALANTWIQTTPPTLTQGDQYEASVALTGSGQVYLDFYNGQQDIDGKTVTLSSTPQTVTVDATIPTGPIGTPQFQVRTPAAEAVNVVASAASIRQEAVVTTPGTTSTSTKGPGQQRVAAGTSGKPVTALNPEGIEPNGTQSRTQVAGTSGLQSGAWVTFDTQAQRDVRMKVGISYVSTEDAKANLAAEDPGWNLQPVRQQTRNAWNQLLDRIRIGGGTHEQQVEFYTALYHALQEPSVFSDANGAYLGFDDKVHRTPPGQAQYANFSGWDVYRSEIPLLATIAPDQTSQMMTSLLNDQAQGGWLPKWGFANNYTDVMNGDAADPMIADAYAFGARGFDLKAALAAMVKGATVDPAPSQLGQGFYDERPQLSPYESLGYVPNVQESSLSPVDNGASETLEYATADFGIAQIAKAAGNDATYRQFLLRSQNWTNVFNTAAGYVEPRDGSGAFPADSPTTAGMSSFGQSGFQEGNAAQYTWSVPQDLHGLITALGGNAAAVSRLDSFFTYLNAGPNQPYEWAGNEPSFGTPWIYDYAGAPYKAQSIVHELLTSAYADTPGGEPGNDDLGAMSSWYVWSSIGLYPQTPGAAVLDVGAPIFPVVQLNVPHGHPVTITAPGATASTYVQSMSVNGRSWADAWVPAGIVTGDGGPAALSFTMGGTPNTSWGAAAQDAPPSYEAAPLTFPPGRTPIVLVPSGPNLLGSTPTGQLNWQGPVQNGVGSVPGTLAAATTPQGASAIHWTEPNAAPDTWVYVQPSTELTANQSYQVSITLQGTGNVFLDFYNGAEDLDSIAVQLTSTPQTLTLQGEVPTATTNTPLQVRTGDAGPIDLYASAANIQLLVPQTGS